ncbi:MAG: pyruvate formate-lyase-activating protein [Candidatus Roizmanbacteria bacterium]
MLVHSLESFGTHEGPGIRFVIFLQGCLFRCLYCHNPDTLTRIGGYETTPYELLQKILKYKHYFSKNGGLTVSGGEPLLQAKELNILFSLVQEAGINTALDTNGYCFDDDVKMVLSHTDLVLLDVKHIDSKKHKVLTGQENKKVLFFADYLEKNNIPFWLRYVLVPGYTDQIEDLEKWAQHFQAYLMVKRVEILPYHTLGVHKYKALNMPYQLKNVLPPTQEQISITKEIFERYLQNVFVQ